LKRGEELEGGRWKADAVEAGREEDDAVASRMRMSAAQTSSAALLLLLLLLMPCSALHCWYCSEPDLGGKQGEVGHEI
jgi:hypothetical protein